jgi:hypothetical protein
MPVLLGSGLRLFEHISDQSISLAGQEQGISTKGGYMRIADDNQIEGWTVTSLPANWQQLRDRWELFHVIRSWVSVLGLALLLGGALLVRDRPVKPLAAEDPL